MSNILKSSSDLSDGIAGGQSGDPLSSFKTRRVPKIWEGEYSPNATFPSAFRHFERSRPLNRLPYGRYSKERREKRLTELNYFGFRSTRIGHWIGSVYERPWLAWLKIFRLTNPPEPYRSTGEFLRKKKTSKRKWGLSRKKQVLNAAFKATVSYNRAMELRKREEGLTNLPDFSYTLDHEGNLVQAYDGRLREPPASVDLYLDRQRQVDRKIKAQDRLIAYRRKTEFANLRRWYLGTSSGITRLELPSFEENEISLDLLTKDMTLLFPSGRQGDRLKEEAKTAKFEWNLLQRHNTRVMINIWKRQKTFNARPCLQFSYIALPPPSETKMQITDLLRQIRAPTIRWRRQLALFYRTTLHPDDPLVGVSIPGEELFIEDPTSGMVEVD